MHKKVSNIAERQLIEKELGIKYKFPKLYTPNSVIDGTQETTLSVITMDQPDHISYAIWGLLPYNYEGEWSDFQKALDTLNVPKENLNSNGIFEEPYHKRRCKIIVTGFFIYHLHNGSLYPYYVYLESKKPFYIAGIYNTLDDGFITCSILTTKATGIVNKIQNLNASMPIFIPDNLSNIWLDSQADIRKISHILGLDNTLKLKAHPIAKEFFKNNISYDSMLDPVYYQGIPIL
ncbi:putative SOS response-associated peptidase YedK [Aquimarina sp. MAR_2010_214]|uniref:SOS response-associated peptidase n=1 Tax=Aquimarina sp. MAR_2010_214 TaxID=1250026 RepID=UPI000C715613|nr:SOS response-associated peptidase family protein [Aquimarina sp. MAR_2010_214]PKV50210.1 putative SOS response-associated peptidase YedK [Aquimarina sp. MAR_2010_214]